MAAKKSAHRIKRVPTLDDIFAAMAAASVGDTTARVAVPDDPPLDDTATKFAIALNLLLNDLALQSSEREQTLQALRTSEERLQQIIDTALDAVITIDDQSRIIGWNNQAEIIFGWQREQIMGQYLYETIIPPQYRRAHRAGVKRFLRTGEGPVLNRRIELTALRCNGDEFPIELAITPARSNERLIFNAFVLDITARKRAEEQIHFQANLVANVSEAIIATDLQFIIQSWNPGAEAIYGWTAAEVIGQPLTKFLQIEFVDNTHEKSVPSIQERAYWNGEVVQSRRDGTKIPILSTVTALKDREGKPLGFVAVNRDMTEHKQAEKELAEALEREKLARAEAEAAKEQISFLAEASGLLTETFDYLGRLKQVAEIAVPRLGDWCAIDVLDADGSAHRVAVVHSDPAKIELAYDMARRYPTDLNAPRGLYHVLRTGESELYPEIPDSILVASAKDAEHLSLMRSLGLKSAMIVPFHARGQNFGAITLVAADSGRRYTNRDLELIQDLARRAALLIDNARLYQEAQGLNAELEQRVRERTALLEAANKELEAFSYSVSHDLRSPLRHISGYVQLLQMRKSDLDAKSLHYLDTIADAARRMGALIDDLLAFSRIGSAEMHRTTIRLGELVHSSIAELQPETKGRKIEWVIAPLPDIQGDPSLLRLVVSNLLSNAVKYTRPRREATIEIGSTADTRESVIFIRDNGVGFDMRYVDKLFGVFQRLHRAEDFEGTGIGLANARRIIQRHGGRTWAEGELDRGATFYFSIPK